MKTQILSLAIFSAMLLSLIISCNKDEDQVTTTDYESYGTWPENAGNWESIRDAAGSKHSGWAYMKIVIKNDGTFKGTYQDYLYDYTYYLINNIPVSIYNPAGNGVNVKGAIDFQGKTGICNFGGIGETTFTLNIFSSSEIAFVFPTGFRYGVSNVKR